MPQPFRRMLRLLALLPLLLADASPASAGDWPQILGINRDGVAPGEQLLEKWPAGGPRLLWQVKLGEGFGGAVVAGERVVAFHRIGKLEQVQCLAASSGKQLWEASFAATYRGGINPDTGPRCTPVIAGDKVIVYGAAGDMHCLQLATGEKLWSRPLSTEYEAPEGYFGAGSSPLVMDQRVLVNVGARDSAAVVCLALADGKTLWTAYNDTASYSSPTAVRWNETEAAICVTRLNCVALRPSDGKVLFEFPFGGRGPTVNAATPLIIGGDRMFLTASYGIGARWVEIAPTGAKILWSSDDALSSQYTTPVYHEGYLYGTHGREDVGVAALRCVEAATGNVMWEQEGFGVAHILSADDKLLIVAADGKVTLAEASPKEFRPLATAVLATDSVRAVPALAGGRLYLRATGQGGGTLSCVVVGAAR